MSPVSYWMTPSDKSAIDNYRDRKSTADLCQVNSKRKHFAGTRKLHEHVLLVLLVICIPLDDRANIVMF